MAARAYNRYNYSLSDNPPLKDYRSPATRLNKKPKATKTFKKKNQDINWYDLIPEQYLQPSKPKPAKRKSYYLDDNELALATAIYKQGGLQSLSKPLKKPRAKKVSFAKPIQQEMQPHNDLISQIYDNDEDDINSDDDTEELDS